jgi:hypothetical protein
MQECAAIAEIESGENVENSLLAAPEGQACVKSTAEWLQPELWSEVDTKQGGEEGEKETTAGKEGRKKEAIRKDEEDGKRRKKDQEEGKKDQEEGTEGKEKRSMHLSFNDTLAYSSLLSSGMLCRLPQAPQAGRFVR